MMPTPVRFTWMRVMYAANIVGAGVPGFLVTFFPEFAETHLFGAVTQDGLLFGVTGSVWLAIGLLSVLGLRYPLPLVSIFMVQIVYKTIWITAVGVPLSLEGDPRALPFVVFFALVAAGFARGAVALPLCKTGGFKRSGRVGTSVPSAGPPRR